MSLEPIGYDTPSLSEIVYTRIREAILTRQLPPGSRVVESAIAKQFSVSKTPVREAILRLAQIGLIVQNGRESRVLSSSRKAIKDAFEVRIALEEEAVRRLGEMSGVQLGPLLDLSEGADDARLTDDLIGRYHDARAFHLVLAELTDNSFLLNSIVSAYDLTWILRHRDSSQAQQSVDNAIQHKRIATLLASGRAEVARQLMVEHLEEVKQVALDTIID